MPTRDAFTRRQFLEQSVHRGIAVRWIWTQSTQQDATEPHWDAARSWRLLDPPALHLLQERVSAHRVGDAAPGEVVERQGVEGLDGGAGVTGIGGALYAHHFNYIEAQNYGVLFSIYVVLYVLLGFAPVVLFGTALLMWWNRVLSPLARRLRETREASLETSVTLRENS